jgi:plastocyanin
MMGFGFMGIGGWLWMLSAVLLLVGVVVLIVSALSASGSSSDEAMAILRARFAGGEIDTDAFAKAKDALGPAPARLRGSRGLLVGVVILVVGMLVGILGWASFGGFAGMRGAGMMGMMGPAPTAPAGTSVTLAGSRFTPQTLTVKVGDSVRWFNDDALPHTVSAVDRSWDSGSMAPGASFERRFETTGTYSYVCLYHSWMTGTIEVAAA